MRLERCQSQSQSILCINVNFLSCLFGVEKFRMYLNKPFVLQTDNMAVSYILKQKKLQGQLARWSVRLQEFDFKIEHIRGTLNVTDPLSRMFEQDDIDGKLEESNTKEICLTLLQCTEFFHSLPESQRGDTELNDIIQQIERGTDVPNHKIIKGVLYFQKNINTKPRIIVPQHMRTMLVKYFHEQPVFAHMGVAKTINRVQREFVWKRMNLCISKFVKSCIGCQKSKPSQNTKIGFMSSRVPTTCNEMFYVDFIGPLTRTTKGNNSIFTVMDGFSKFMFFLPVKKQTSAVAIECIKNFVFAQQGLCRTLVSGNGSNFMSREFFSFLFQLGIKQYLHITHSQIM